MPEEMILLRNALDARGIAWVNAADNFDRSFPFLNMITYRTVFTHNDNTWSVASGYGSFGGHKGLLELVIGQGEKKGSLKATDVLQMMDGKENK